MSDMQRLHRITYLIQARKCVPINVFLDELEISKAISVGGFLFLALPPCRGFAAL